VIEIDGSIHQTEEVKNNDKKRDEFLQTLNLKIIRFTNDEVCKNGENIVKKLKELMDSLPIN
jgi:very-short-patch-repair endonuclease